MSRVDRNLVPPPASEAVQLLRDLKAAGKPIPLSIDGKVTIAVTDEASFAILESLVDRLELIESVRTGLREAKQGQGISLEEFTDEVRRKNGVSS